MPKFFVADARHPISFSSRGGRRAKKNDASVPNGIWLRATAAANRMFRRGDISGDRARYDTNSSSSSSSRALTNRDARKHSGGKSSDMLAEKPIYANQERERESEREKNKTAGPDRRTPIAGCRSIPSPAPPKQDPLQQSASCRVLAVCFAYLASISTLAIARSDDGWRGPHFPGHHLASLDLFTYSTTKTKLGLRLMGLRVARSIHYSSPGMAFDCSMRECVLAPLKSEERLVIGECRPFDKERASNEDGCGKKMRGKCR